MTTPVRNGRTVAEVVREYFPDADEHVIEHLMWCETGWPCFWKSNDPEDAMRLSLAKAACRENFAMFEYFDSDKRI